MKVTTTSDTCKDPGRQVIRRDHFIEHANTKLDPRFKLDMLSLNKGMEIYSAINKRKKLTIVGGSRHKYILAEVADELMLFILGRQKDIPEWRRRALARSKRAKAVFTKAGVAELPTEEDVESIPYVSAEAAQEVNRILNGGPSKIASLYADALLAAPDSKPVLRLGANSYISLYEGPRV